jgi:Protein of unknown function (DUF669)
MAKLDDVFDPSAVEPADTFEPLPAGNYPVEVIESTVDDTKNGLGRLLKVTLRVIDGEYEGRRIWGHITIRHQNEVAQRIGQQLLGALCNAAGAGPIEDTEDLHGIPVTAKIVIENDKTGQYGPRNVIRGFMPLQQRAPAAAPAVKAAPAARPAVGGAAPWKR